MQFFASAITTLQTLVIALGAGLGVWGVVNLLEGYGSDNPGASNCAGIKTRPLQSALRRRTAVLKYCISSRRFPFEKLDLRGVW